MLRVAGLIALTAVMAGCQPTRLNRQMMAICSPPEDLSTLSGADESKNIGINSKGKHKGHSTLTMRVDRDGVITAQRRWTSKTDFGHNEQGALTKGDTEDLIGVFDPSDCEFGFAETEESGNYRGQLLADGSIDLMQLQAGLKPAVMMNRFRRSAQPN